MGRLDGRVALITGGARGQGAAEAKLFTGEGAAVVLTDMRDDEGNAAAAACGGLYLHHDVSNPQEWEAVVREVSERHGRIDVLVNNAGIFLPGRLWDTTLDVWNRVIAVNQTSVFLGMQAVAKVMGEQRSGSIINISSVAGMRGGAGSFPYTASKWAVRGMTKTAARDLARFGIRVNSIHPGPIETPMLHEIPGVDARGSDSVLPGVALRRLGEAEEVAKLALFLASDDSSYCTGAEFVVDGGYTA